MKIHNLGSDYAHQQRLRKKIENQQEPQPIVQPESNPTDNVEYQIQTGGETTLATADNEAHHCDQSITQETKKTTRKKKKERANDIQ